MPLLKKDTGMIIYVHDHLFPYTLLIKLRHCSGSLFS